jgi:hypothetical protein
VLTLLKLVPQRVAERIEEDGQVWHLLGLVARFLFCDRLLQDIKEIDDGFDKFELTR